MRRAIHSFPTRRSSDLLTLSAQVSGTNNSTLNWSVNGVAGGNATLGQICVAGSSPCQTVTASSAAQVEDRKSTRLNSSHVKISYAVLCLKKKTGHVKDR